MMSLPRKRSSGRTYRLKRPMRPYQPVLQDMGMSETGQKTGPYGLDGDTVATQHRMRKQMPYKVYGKKQETSTVQATQGPNVIKTMNHSVVHGTEVVKDTTVLKTSVDGQELPFWDNQQKEFKITREQGINELVDGIEQ